MSAYARSSYLPQSASQQQNHGSAASTQYSIKDNSLGISSRQGRLASLSQSSRSGYLERKAGVRQVRLKPSGTEGGGGALPLPNENQCASTRSNPTTYSNELLRSNHHPFHSSFSGQVAFEPNSSSEMSQLTQSQALSGSQRSTIQSSSSSYQQFLHTMKNTELGTSRSNIRSHGSLQSSHPSQTSIPSNQSLIRGYGCSNEVLRDPCINSIPEVPLMPRNLFSTPSHAPQRSWMYRVMTPLSALVRSTPQRMAQSNHPPNIKPHLTTLNDAFTRSTSQSSAFGNTSISSSSHGHVATGTNKYHEHEQTGGAPLCREQPSSRETEKWFEALEQSLDLKLTAKIEKLEAKEKHLEEQLLEIKNSAKSVTELMNDHVSKIACEGDAWIEKLSAAAKDHMALLANAVEESLMKLTQIADGTIAKVTASGAELMSAAIPFLTDKVKRISKDLFQSWAVQQQANHMNSELANQEMVSCDEQSARTKDNGTPSSKETIVSRGSSKASPMEQTESRQNCRNRRAKRVKVSLLPSSSSVVNAHETPLCSIASTSSSSRDFASSAPCPRPVTTDIIERQTLDVYPFEAEDNGSPPVTPKRTQECSSTKAETPSVNYAEAIFDARLHEFGSTTLRESSKQFQKNPTQPSSPKLTPAATLTMTNKSHVKPSSHKTKPSDHGTPLYSDRIESLKRDKSGHSGLAEGSLFDLTQCQDESRVNRNKHTPPETRASYSRQNKVVKVTSSAHKEKAIRDDQMYSEYAVPSTSDKSTTSRVQACDIELLSKNLQQETPRKQEQLSSPKGTPFSLMKKATNTDIVDVTPSAQQKKANPDSLRCTTSSRKNKSSYSTLGVGNRFVPMDLQRETQRNRIEQGQSPKPTSDFSLTKTTIATPIGNTMETFRDATPNPTRSTNAKSTDHDVSTPTHQQDMKRIRNPYAKTGVTANQRLAKVSDSTRPPASNQFGVNLKVHPRERTMDPPDDRFDFTASKATGADTTRRNPFLLHNSDDGALSRDTGASIDMKVRSQKGTHHRDSMPSSALNQKSQSKSNPGKRNKDGDTRVTPETEQEPLLRRSSRIQSRRPQPDTSSTAQGIVGHSTRAIRPTKPAQSPSTNEVEARKSSSKRASQARPSTSYGRSYVIQSDRAKTNSNVFTPKASEISASSVTGTSAVIASGQVVSNPACHTGSNLLSSSAPGSQSGVLMQARQSTQSTKAKECLSTSRTASPMLGNVAKENDENYLSLGQRGQRVTPIPDKFDNSISGKDHSTSVLHQVNSGNLVAPRRRNRFIILQSTNRARSPGEGLTNSASKANVPCPATVSKLSDPSSGKVASVTPNDKKRKDIPSIVSFPSKRYKTYGGKRAQNSTFLLDDEFAFL